MNPSSPASAYFAEPPLSPGAGDPVDAPIPLIRTVEPPSAAATPEPPPTLAPAPAPAPAAAPAPAPAAAPEPSIPTIEAPPAPLSTPLEALLLRFRLVTPDQMATAMREETETGKDLATIVVEKGWVSAEDLASVQAYADSRAAAAAPAQAPAPAPAPPEPAPFVAPVLEPTPPPAPAPVLEPTPEPLLAATPEPLLAATPEPLRVAAPEPLLAAEPEPLLAPVPAPVAQAPILLEPELVQQPVTAPPALEPELPPAPASMTTRVLVRLTTGERVDCGTYEDRQAAHARARDLMRELRGDGEWPFVAGRFVRPDAVVSIDLELLAR